MDNSVVGVYITRLEFPFIILGSILFAFLGIIGAIVSWKVYRHLRKSEEVSMVSFLLNPRETVQEIRIINRASLIGFVGWLVYTISLIIWLWNKDIGNALSWVVFIVSLYFSICLIRVNYRWKRRFEKFE